MSAMNENPNNPKIPESERLAAEREAAEKAAKGETQTPEEAAKLDKYIKILTVAVAAVAAGLAISMLSTRVIAPTYHYGAGDRAMTNGEYEDAIEEFAAAGDYKDAAEKLTQARQYYANFLAGKPDAVSFVSAGVPWLSIEDGVISFSNDKYEKTKIPTEGVVTLPDVLDGQLVTSIKEKTFLNADTMVSVNIPDSVGVIPDSCFYNCYSLSDITLGSKVTAIEQRAFLNCTSLTEMTLPETVNRIGLRAFNNCYSLVTVDIRGPVESIMPYTFSECVSLREISLPSSVTSIAEGAFTDCEALQTVNFAGTEEEWKQIDIAEGNEWLTNAEIHYNMSFRKKIK